MARRPPPPRLIGSGLIPGTFQDQYNAAEEDYQGGLAGLQKDERSLFQDYGFQGGIGADGAVNFGVDPNNQFGQYQGLLRQIGGQLGQAKQEVKGRGIGRAGLAKARENLIRFMMSGEKANLATGFSKAAGDIFGKRGAALTGRNRRFGELEGNALEWWYGPDNPYGTIPEGDGGPAAESPAAAFAPSGMTDGYQQSMELAQYLAAQNPAANNSGDSDYYGGMVYSPPQYAPAPADPYAQVPTAGQVRRPRGGGGGGPMLVM